MQRTERSGIKITGAGNKRPGTSALIITALSPCPHLAEVFCEQSTQPEAALPWAGSTILTLVGKGSPSHGNPSADHFLIHFPYRQSDSKPENQAAASWLSGCVSVSTAAVQAHITRAPLLLCWGYQRNQQTLRAPWAVWSIPKPSGCFPCGKIPRLY